MTAKEIFKIWAPTGAKWVDWVRPVPFVGLDNSQGAKQAYRFEIPLINYLSALPDNTAVIVDLPSSDSIEEGLALAQLGFRPIPLFNGTNEQAGAMALVDNRPMEMALQWGASVLAKIALPPNAPPAFLLDSNRLHRYKMKVAIFDNSWDLYDQDLPSAEHFLSSGITKIIVHSEKLSKDLQKIFQKFLQKGVKILFTDGYEMPKEVVIKKRNYDKI
jgi:hypothetical protein